MDIETLINKVSRLIDKKGKGQVAWFIFLSQSPGGSRYLSNAVDPKHLAQLLRKCADDLEAKATDPV